MRSVAEHLAACLDIAQAAAPLDVVLLDAVGCVLAEDVVAQLDLPVVDMAGLDGYAVAVDDLAGVFPGRPVSGSSCAWVLMGVSSQARKACGGSRGG